MMIGVKYAASCALEVANLASIIAGTVIPESRVSRSSAS